MSHKTKEDYCPPPAEPKEKAVFLRMKPEDIELIAELKKEFNATTSNQAVSRGLQDWKKQRAEIAELRLALNNTIAERDRYESDLRASGTAFDSFSLILKRYSKIAKL